jgi:hypothetical protein
VRILLILFTSLYGPLFSTTSLAAEAFVSRTVP